MKKKLLLILFGIFLLKITTFGMEEIKQNTKIESEKQKEDFIIEIKENEKNILTAEEILENISKTMGKIEKDYLIDVISTKEQFDKIKNNFNNLEQNKTKGHLLPIVKYARHLEKTLKYFTEKYLFIEYAKKIIKTGEKLQNEKINKKDDNQIKKIKEYITKFDQYKNNLYEYYNELTEFIDKNKNKLSSNINLSDDSSIDEFKNTILPENDLFYLIQNVFDKESYYENYYKNLNKTLNNEKLTEFFPTKDDKKVINLEYMLKKIGSNEKQTVDSILNYYKNKKDIEDNENLKSVYSDIINSLKNNFDENEKALTTVKNIVDIYDKQYEFYPNKINENDILEKYLEYNEKHINKNISNTISKLINSTESLKNKSNPYLYVIQNFIEYKIYDILNTDKYKNLRDSYNVYLNNKTKDIFSNNEDFKNKYPTLYNFIAILNSFNKYLEEWEKSSNENKENYLKYIIKTTTLFLNDKIYEKYDKILNDIIEYLNNLNYYSELIYNQIPYIIKKIDVIINVLGSQLHSWNKFENTIENCKNETLKKSALAIYDKLKEKHEYYINKKNTYAKIMENYKKKPIFKKGTYDKEHQNIENKLSNLNNSYGELVTKINDISKVKIPNFNKVYKPIKSNK